MGAPTDAFVRKVRIPIARPCRAVAPLYRRTALADLILPGQSLSVSANLALPSAPTCRVRSPSSHNSASSDVHIPRTRASRNIEKRRSKRPIPGSSHSTRPEHFGDGREHLLYTRMSTRSNSRPRMCGLESLLQLPFPTTATLNQASTSHVLQVLAVVFVVPSHP